VGGLRRGAGEGHWLRFVSCVPVPVLRACTVSCVPEPTAWYRHCKISDSRRACVKNKFAYLYLIHICPSTWHRKFSKLFTLGPFDIG
jgi:hypothetical protein